MRCTTTRFPIRTYFLAGEASSSHIPTCRSLSIIMNHIGYRNQVLSLGHKQHLKVTPQRKSTCIVFHHSGISPQHLSIPDETHRKYFSTIPRLGGSTAEVTTVSWTGLAVSLEG